jgi:hypothetical protein
LKNISKFAFINMIDREPTCIEREVCHMKSVPECEGNLIISDPEGSSNVATVTIVASSVGGVVFLMVATLIGILIWRKKFGAK